MIYLRNGFIAAAALLTAVQSCGLAAASLERVNAATIEVPPHAGHAQTGLQDPPIPAQPSPPSGPNDSDLADPGTIQGNAAGGRPGSRNAALASPAAQPPQRMEFGWSPGDDAIISGSTGWYGVYLQSLDRVPERNTIYGLLRETPRPGRNDSKTPTSLDQFASSIGTRQASPTFFLFGLLRKKGWHYNLDNSWKLQAGTRNMQYSGMPRSKIGFLSVEHQWESLRTSYSYQLERSSGLGIAPGHVLQIDYLYGPHNSIGVSFMNGREFADFGALGILNTQVRDIGIRGQHWFKQDWALTFQAGFKNHGNLPAHNGIRMGLRHSF